MLDSSTRKITVEDDGSQEIRSVLTAVYAALQEKGYNPVNQIVGYLFSEDPTYITSHNNARGMIRRLDREELVRELVRKYLM